jgi:hypothetical protein
MEIRRSFIISKIELSKNQIVNIRSHAEILSAVIEGEYQAWVIEEDKDFICGYTELDNIGMPSFLYFAVGLDDSIITWGEGLHDLKKWLENK